MWQICDMYGSMFFGSIGVIVPQIFDNPGGGRENAAYVVTERMYGN